MMEKRLLAFYPHNFYEMSSGTHRRFYNLMEYFKSRGFKADLLSIDGFTNRWGTDAGRRDFFETINTCRWNPSLVRKGAIARQMLRGRLPDFAVCGLPEEFRRMYSAWDYDFVLVSYVYWASLAEAVGEHTVKVIDLHDFITLNQYISKGRGEFTLGRMFEDEVRAISGFDCALSISEEETLALEPFCPETRFVNVPVSFDPAFLEEGGYEFDLLFVGSDNPFNREGIAWFMDEVYPLLSPELRIAVVGKMSGFVEKKDNVTLVESVPELEGYYRRSRVVGCPLKGGTGLKVKVVEALSYGRPVVTTGWGLSGIIRKKGNGCLLADSPEEFARAVERLCKDNEEYREVKDKGKDFFLEHFSTSVCYDRLDTVFLD